MQNPLQPGVARLNISYILLKIVSFCSIYISKVGQVISKIPILLTSSYRPFMFQVDRVTISRKAANIPPLNVFYLFNMFGVLTYYSQLAD